MNDLADIKKFRKHFFIFLCILIIFIFCSCKEQVFICYREGRFKATEISYNKNIEKKWDNIELIISFLTVNEDPHDFNNALLPVLNQNGDFLYYEFEFHISIDSFNQKVYFSLIMAEGNKITFQHPQGYILEMTMFSNDNSSEHLVSGFHATIFENGNQIGKCTLNYII